MIKHLKIDGLNGNKSPLEFKFNDDLNLFTGLNGCGKTTILKILWFVNSGKYTNLLQGVNFKSLKLETDKYYVIIAKDSAIIKWKIEGGKKEKSDHIPLNQDNFILHSQLSTEINSLYDYSDSSIFFPTFRRIEGGFSMAGYNSRFRRSSLKEVLSELSDELSTRKHQFVASVSTDDITSLINREYSLIARDINEMQRKQFDEIRKQTRNKRGQNSDEILKEIESKIKQVEQNSIEKLKPFTVLEDLIRHIFRKKGIAMESIRFGYEQNVISSDKLSAGEKQMLSFLCYNTFSKNKVIFIDEPELSLHPDWQRLLIPTLLKQGNNNQFFIATHSPFIYTKYPDKEIVINSDKGE